ncbi:hypothetical protein [Streptomyces atratus]|uniref:Uncharacterized protein n=1 Tax=Streptomyces atratus TaxID=1893 RepID=A0A2Z5JRW8_STRAR|nr:hypothetical protein [Streptomyces atratus]AXE82145.1 hypothetical protein C5746_40630 [Streptomyces atratus]
MDPIVVAAATAVVDVMAVDAWQQTRAAVVDWWRRVRPAQADTVGVALDLSHTQILAARQVQDAAGEQAVVTAWRTRLQALVEEEPVLVGELRRLLDEELLPAVAAQQAAAAPVTMKATASGRGRVYQAGRDQHITEQ